MKRTKIRITPLRLFYSWSDFEDDIKGGVRDAVDFAANPIGWSASQVATGNSPTENVDTGVQMAKDYMNPKAPPAGSPAYYPGWEEDYSISVEDQKELAKWQFDENMKNFPKISGAALDNALSTSGNLDKFMSERFYKNLENVLPNWREDIIGRSINQLDAISAITDDQLRGEVPQDVSDYIIRTRAELGISRGLFGEASTYATARDLGKTSMDIQQMGVQNAVNAVSPLTQRLLSYAQQLQPPTSNVESIYGAGMSALSGVNLVGVGDVMRMGLASDQFNSQMSWAQAQSQINYDIMQQQMKIQQKQFDDAQDSSFWNNMISAGATIAGLALAPATGGLSLGAAAAWSGMSGPSGSGSLLTPGVSGYGLNPTGNFQSSAWNTPSPAPSFY